ncbi:MAG: hypothetical protein AAGA58_17775 [Verrucomicrobiota bacterium]
MPETEKTPLDLPRELFWDVDPAKVDPERHAGTVISRVVMLGRLEDWKKIRKFYGDKKMIETVTGLRDLPLDVVSLCCVAFDLKKEDFRCCTSRPFGRAPWIY